MAADLNQIPVELRARLESMCADALGTEKRHRSFNEVVRNNFDLFEELNRACGDRQAVCDYLELLGLRTREETVIGVPTLNSALNSG